MTAKIYVKKFQVPHDWRYMEQIQYEKYTISESDFRNKTASFTTNRNLNLSEDTWAVRIVCDSHETFNGIILRKTDKPSELIEYACQDFNRLYMSKPNGDYRGTVYSIVKELLKYVSLGGDQTNGLLARNRYKYKGTVRFNPMETRQEFNTNDRTVKELIEQLIYSQGSNIELTYNDAGVLRFIPYKTSTWQKPVATFNHTNIIDYDFNWDTTDIITAVEDNGKIYRFNDLLGRLNPLVWQVYAETSVTETTNTTTKTSNNNNKTGNPYNTKKKEVWVNMDRCWSTTTDNKYLNKFCKELKKLGWKVHNLGVRPSLHTDYSKAGKCKGGIWLTLDNGVDCEVLRHLGHDQWFKGQLVKNGSRAVIGFINDAGDIRRGGKYYKNLPMAHDGTGKGNPAIKYPAGYCADCGLPFFYSTGNNPVKSANLFNSGGESKIAVQNSYKRRLKPYYTNWNWGRKY